MKEVMNAKNPLFNSTQARLFEKNKAEMIARPQCEIEERRYKEPTTKYIEEFILENLVDQWLTAKTRFIKARYY